MRRLLAALFALAVLVALAASGCAKQPPPAEPLPPAARVVDDLLSARSEGVTDTAVYERLVESTEVAAALAEDSADREDPPTPEWRAPRVLGEATQTARVEVRWVPSEKYEGWPAQTVFEVKRVGDRWLVTGAEEETASAEPTSTP